jgi:methylglutaconyl-CoA hydratase
MDPLVKIQVHNHTATVTLNRPAKRNALSRALLGELHQALDDLHQERRVRGLILTGAGAAFCAGMDLDEMKAAGDQENRHAQWHADALAYHELIETMLRFPKPLIAAVGGAAVAGGAGLVMACDLVVASDEASFGFPEPRRGVVAGMVAPLLAFRVGAAHAAYLLLTAKIIDAREAHRYGLFHELVAADKVWARANQLVGEIAQSSPEA